VRTGVGAFAVHRVCVHRVCEWLVAQTLDPNDVFATGGQVWWDGGFSRRHRPAG
jgi:hypothetical protein